MGGSSTAILTAFATPAKAARMWDHTYVASDCGWLWRCWGACAGGSVLVQNPGDSFIANCLSKPQGTAGIRYGRSGVCHQTANRILDPAGIKVTMARGYLTSYKVFGHYGRGDWTQRSKCYSLGNASPEHAIYEPSGAQSIAGRKDPVMAFELPDHSPLATTNRTDSLREQLMEIRVLCDSKLDEPLSDFEVQSLQYVFESTRSSQEQLDRELQAENCSPEQYLNLLNDLLRDSAKRERQILGTKRFERVFGDAGSHPEGLVDPEEFLSSFE